MKLRDIYKCNVCGNVVEVIYGNTESLVCCGEDMEKLEAKTEDYTVEKHVPMVEETDEGVEVIVGSTLHPMEEKHYITSIEVLTADKVLRAELKPGEEPKAEFAVDKEEIEDVREYCNVHGLWKA